MFRKIAIISAAVMTLAAAAVPAQAVQCPQGWGGTLNCVDQGS